MQSVINDVIRVRKFFIVYNHICVFYKTPLEIGLGLKGSKLKEMRSFSGAYGKN